MIPSFRSLKFFSLVLLLFFLSSGCLDIILTPPPGPSFPQPSGIDDLYEILPDIQTCYEGILKDSEKQKVLEELNFIRSLHGLNPVNYNYEDDIYTAKAALIIVANEEMNHHPDQSYKCWTEEGEFGSSRSNLYMWGVGRIKFLNQRIS